MRDSPLTATRTRARAISKKPHETAPPHGQSRKGPAPTERKHPSTCALLESA
ncbi:hypothetical protein GCM10017687_82550 [Streptomyces echinatus]